jgi:hypothetical protein
MLKANTTTFHCHICVDLDFYLNILESNPISNFERMKPNREWFFNDTRNGMESIYIQNVRYYKEKMIEKSNTWIKEEIAEIERKRASTWRVNPFNAIKMRNDMFEIRYDLQEPKISISHKNVQLNELSSLFSLAKGARDIGLELQLFSKPNGSHICIDINSKYAYILTSGDKYYDLHPRPSEFFDNFKKLKNFFIET